MNTRSIALTSIFTSLSVVGRISLIFVPNISLVGPLAILGGYLSGGISGFLIGFLGMFISDMFIGVGPWTPITSFFMGISGLLSGLFLRKTSDRMILFIASFMFTLFYDIMTSIVTMSMFGVSPLLSLMNLFLPIFIGFIPYPMGPIHEFSTAFLFVSIVKILDSYPFVRWFKYG